MGIKGKKESEPSDDDYSDEDSGSQVDIEQQVQNKIKQLPTLKDKIQAIAVNSYMIEKRALDKQLQNEIQKVQLEFRNQFKPFINDINTIIQGSYVLNDVDCQQFAEIFFTGEEMANLSQHLKVSKIPEYWLKVFLNSDVLSEQVEQRDEPLLKHLEKIQSYKEDFSKLTLVFYFSQNEWFSNAKVEKHFDLEQGSVTKSYGDAINWKEGKNITEKIVKKKGKKAKKTKVVKQRSFFNFFREVDENTQEDDESMEQGDDEVEELQLHEQMAFTIYEDLIPKSIEYYLDVASSMADEETPKKNLQALIEEKKTAIQKQKKDNESAQEKDQQRAQGNEGKQEEQEQE